MTDEHRLGIGLPFDGGIIVDIQGDKWGVVEMPSGRRTVRDVSSAIANERARREWEDSESDEHSDP